MNIGELGEEIVARWTIASGGEILQRRWRWRRGEIDLIAIVAGTLLFIEVKTRDRRNWDADGLLAITPQKQLRLVTAAEQFLVKYPDLAAHPCRFDVAIVRHQRLHQPISDTYLDILEDLDTDERLLLLDYLPGAFDRA